MVSQRCTCREEKTTALIDLSFLQFEDKSDGLLAGFSDGVIRYLKIRSTNKSNPNEKKLDYDLRMVQVLKPHTKPVTHIAVEVKHQWIATGVIPSLLESTDRFGIRLEF